MSRSATTGIYTRIDNSFSNPVVGTTIDPSHADTYFDDIDGAMNSFIGTSTTSLTIGTGTKTFTTQLTKSFLVGSFVQAFSQADHANYMYGSVISYDTGTGALSLDVTVTGGSGTLTDWLLFTAGARGGTGATGAQGNPAGFKYTFNTATSGDPGSGKFLFNNATFASATAMNISETDGDGNGLAALLATLDDSTSTNKCIVFFQKENDTEGFLAYLTGTITDNGGYDTFSITPITALGTMADNDVCRLIPVRVGDKGTDGAGTGDVVGPASAVADSIPRFSGTTGKLLKAGTVAGTDYMHPGTTSTLTKGFSATSFSAGTKSSGTYTPDPADGGFQHATNGGAHTLAPPTNSCSIVVEYLNNGSAGAITTSGFTRVYGAFDTTNTNKFLCNIIKTNSYSLLQITPLQ